jgi:hypothetical protein
MQHDREQNVTLRRTLSSHILLHYLDSTLILLRLAPTVTATAPVPLAPQPRTLHSAASRPSAAVAGCGLFSRRTPPADAGRGADSFLRRPVDLDVEHALAPVRRDAGDDNVHLKAPV